MKKWKNPLRVKEVGGMSYWPSNMDAAKQIINVIISRNGCCVVEERQFDGIWKLTHRFEPNTWDRCQIKRRGMKLVENVTVLPAMTTLDLDVERVLQAAIDAKPAYVLVIGEDAEGRLYFASSKSDGGEALWWMEKAKREISE